MIPDQQLLLACTSGILLLGLFLYHEADDLKFALYMMGVGVAFEYVGVTQNLWSYPGRDFTTASVQFTVMWGAAGLFFRRIAGLWLIQSPITASIYQPAHFELAGEVQDVWLKAKQLRSRGENTQAWVEFCKIEKRCEQRLYSLNYTFCVEAADTATAMGYLRKAVQLNREALKFVTCSEEYAFLHLRLCRLYRMMIYMKNARFELVKAFQHLGVHFPRSTVGSLIYECIQMILNLRKIHQPLLQREKHRLELHVALIEEAGLSAYYFREMLALVQCTLIPMPLAKRLGPSPSLMNWLGGSACVFAILKQWKLSHSFLYKAEVVANSMDNWGCYPKAKMLLWRGLAYDYMQRPKESAEYFSRILAHHRNDLPEQDFRLVAATLACNLALRGHMVESNSCIERLYPDSSTMKSHYSGSQMYVDWYRVPALSFIGRSEELNRIIRNSKTVFSSIDVEKWQITQFLGGLLIYYYMQDEKPIDEIEDCFARFDSLKLSAKTTYLEACHYWVGKSYVMLDLFEQKKVGAARVKVALRNLKLTPSHPSLRTHHRFLQAKFSWLQNPKSTVENELAQVQQLAGQHQNNWIKYEIFKLTSQIYKSRGEAARAEDFSQRAQELAESLNWHACAQVKPGKTA